MPVVFADSKMDVKEEDNVCIVCWREIHVYAIGLCDHPVCHECSTRMRVLCRKSECPICRRNLPKVLFVKQCRPYEELNKRLYPVDPRPQICFEDDSVRQAYRELLENRCKYCPPVPEPTEEGGGHKAKRPVFTNFAMLRAHVRKEHSRSYCDLCVEHLKIFPSERTAYSKRDMARHQSQGDVEDTSHKGHPLCKFCETRYFDNDELYRHLRRDHYYCHFCGDDYRLQYYRNYEYLRAHFREQHFLCEEGDCRNETFTAAFRSEIDLKAHRAQHHHRSLTKAQAKQARTLDLEFAVAPRASANNPHASGHYYDDSGQPGGRRQPRQSRPSRGQPDGGRDEPGASGPFGSSSQASSVTWELPPPVDYQCEKEFPQLGSDSASAAGPASSSASQQRVAPFPVASSYPPRRPDRVDVNSVDDFPSLNPSTAPAVPTATNCSRTLVALRKAAKPQANGVTGGRGVAAKQQDANNNATGKKSSATLAAEVSGASKLTKSQPTVSAVVSARPVLKAQLAPESKAGTKKVFEEDFPSLATRPIARVSIAPSLPPASQSEPPWSTAKSKTKKKKKGDEGKQLGSLLQTSSATEINNNNGGADVSTGVSTSAAKKPSEEAAPVASCPTNNLLQLISAARKGVANKPTRPPTTGMDSEEDDSDLDEAPTAPVPVLTPVDFPCLNGRSTARTAAPPPGFSKPKPPPGFMRVMGGPDGTVGLSLASVAPAATAAAAAPPQYMQPANFQQRNQKLIQDVQRMLTDRSEEEGRFAKFKSLSGAFRQGALTANEYFARCVELFGSEKEFCLIFPELLFLLPDIPKQQQLMATFNVRRRALATTSGALPKATNVQLLVCATCQQVLSAEDFRSHRTMHDPA